MCQGKAGAEIFHLREVGEVEVSEEDGALMLCGTRVRLV